MNISGIRTYAGFYDYNTIKNREEKNQQIEAAKAAEVREEMEREQEREALEVQPAEEKKPDTGAIDYAMQYQPDAAYELKGYESDIANLDVEKALSDLKKDQVLQQYQFFVGERGAGEGLADGQPDENFSL